MNRVFKLATIATLLCCPMRIEAQYQSVELADIQLARSVGATVHDPTGAAVRNAAVKEFNADWKIVLRAGSADADGKFSFAPVAGRKIYFIQISAPGFDPLRFRLQVDAKHGVDLRLKLMVAT